jgi:hypothetical protein
MAQTYEAGDVAQHNKPDNLWIIIDEDVYDVTKFQDEHPGGKKSMLVLPVLAQLQRSNNRHSSSASGRQGCEQAVLEIPQ